MPPQTTRKRSIVGNVALHAGLNLLHVIFAGPIVLIACWAFYVGVQRWANDDFWQTFPPDYGCDDTVLLDRCSVQQLLYMWLAPTVLAFTAVGLLALRAILPHEHHRGGHWNKISSYLLPPRQFWLWWCGGITVSDFLAICVWIALNATWMTVILKRFWTLIPVFTKLTGAPSLELQVELVAVALGCLLFPNLVLLFYPISRGSVLLQATGLSYPDAIRYHRWLGHAVMIMVTAHSVGLWGVWIYQGQWTKEAFDQGDRINNLAGGVSFLSGLALWLSSLEVARRSSYEVFYKLHHIGFWGFTFAGCCHVWSMFWYFLPGLVLYGIDAVYRIQQALWEGSVISDVTSGKSNKRRATVHVLEAVASKNNSICSLLLTAPRYAVSATGFIWINVPEISWHSWHPFEYFAVPVDESCYNHVTDSQNNKSGAGSASSSSSSSTGMLVHIKAYDRWTSELVKLVAQQQQYYGSSSSSDGSSSGVNFRVKVEGPYAELPSAVLGHPEVAAAAAAATDGSSSNGKGLHYSMVDGVILVAGGVGITAAMSVLQELSVTGTATDGLPTLLIWTCRYVDELEFLTPRLMAMANALGLKITVKLYYTGDTRALTAAAPAGSSSTDHPPTSTTAADIGSSGSSSSSSSARLVTSSMCPMVGLRSFWSQAGHKLLLHVIACAGVLGAILLVRYYSAVLPARHGTQPWTTAQMGTAYILTISAAIVIPGTLLLWITLAAANLTSSSSSSSSDKVQEGDKADLTVHLLEDGAAADTSTTSSSNRAAAAAVSIKGHLAAAQLSATAAAAGADKVSWQLHLPAAAAAAAAVFPVELGRPSLPQLISSWLATHRLLPAAEQQQQQYDVYGMGPVKLVADVQVICDDVNKRGSVQMNFVQKTHEL